LKSRQKQYYAGTSVRLDTVEQVVLNAAMLQGFKPPNRLEIRKFLQGIEDDLQAAAWQGLLTRLAEEVSKLQDERKRSAGPDTKKWLAENIVSHECVCQHDKDYDVTTIWLRGDTEAICMHCLRPYYGKDVPLGDTYMRCQVCTSVMVKRDKAMCYDCEKEGRKPTDRPKPPKDD